MIPTNRAMATLSLTAWNAPIDLIGGLLVGAATPAAIDIAAEIYVLNNLSELLALTGVDEPSDGSYSRADVVPNTATEDDTNHVIHFPVQAVSFGALTNSTVYGFWLAVDGANDAARVLLGVDLFTAQVTNGAGTVWRPNSNPTAGDAFTFAHS